MPESQLAVIGRAVESPPDDLLQFAQHHVYVKQALEAQKLFYLAMNDDALKAAGFPRFSVLTIELEKMPLAEQRVVCVHNRRWIVARWEEIEPLFRRRKLRLVGKDEKPKKHCKIKLLGILRGAWIPE